MTTGLEMKIHMDEDTKRRTEEVMRQVWRKGADLSTPYRKFGTYLHRVTVQAFDRGGHRGEWPPLSPLTLILRKARGKRKNPRRMLQDRGILKGSLTTKVSNRDMKFGTSVPYAAIHQFGGEDTLSLPAVTIVPKKAKALKFVVRSGETVFASRVHMPAREIRVTIPARPYLVYMPEDNEVLVRYVSDHLERGVR